MAITHSSGATYGTGRSLFIESAAAMHVSDFVANYSAVGKPNVEIGGASPEGSGGAVVLLEDIYMEATADTSPMMLIDSDATVTLIGGQFNCATGCPAGRYGIENHSVGGFSVVGPISTAGYLQGAINDIAAGIMVPVTILASSGGYGGYIPSYGQKNITTISTQTPLLLGGNLAGSNLDIEPNSATASSTGTLRFHGGPGNATILQSNTNGQLMYGVTDRTKYNTFLFVAADAPFGTPPADIVNQYGQLRFENNNPDGLVIISAPNGTVTANVGSKFNISTGLSTNNYVFDATSSTPPTGPCTSPQVYFSLDGSITSCPSGTFTLKTSTHSDYATIDAAMFGLDTMLGPVYFESTQVSLQMIIVRMSGTIACSTAPAVALMDLGTSASTLYSGATMVGSPLSTGTSDSVYSSPIESIPLVPGHYYGYAFTAGTCTTAPTFDITAQLG